MRYVDTTVSLIVLVTSVLFFLYGSTRHCHRHHHLWVQSNLDYGLCPTGEHLTEDFKKEINRFQRVPCIHDNGYKLAESVAILRYLSAKGKIPEHLYPKYFVDQSRVDEFLEWQHMSLRLTCAMYFRTVWLEPLLTGRTPSEAKIETFRMQMERNLDVVEEVWLEGKDFLTGSSLTVADIFAACEIEQTREHTFSLR